MKAAYRFLALATAALVVFQAAAIAVGLFLIVHNTDDGVAYTKSTGENGGQALHSIGAMVLSVVVLALLIVSFFAHVDRGVALAGIVVGLVVLQWVLAIVAFSAPAIGALHAVNAFAIAGVASAAAGKAKGSGAAATTAPAADPV